MDNFQIEGETISAIKYRIFVLEKRYTIANNKLQVEMNYHKKIFNKAKKEYISNSTNCQKRINILKNDYKKDLNRLQGSKILTNISKSVKSCIICKAYEIAIEADKDDIQKIKEKIHNNDIPDLTYYIAWDLLCGKMGIFPSSDIDKWYEYHKRNK